MPTHNICFVQEYAWPLLVSGMSEVLGEADWMLLWDNVLSSHPGYLLLCVAAFVINNRIAILHCTCHAGTCMCAPVTRTSFDCTLDADVVAVFHQPSRVDIIGVIKLADRLKRDVPANVNPCKQLDPLVYIPPGAMIISSLPPIMMFLQSPTPAGQYPVFNKYPTFVVDYQIQERERIRQEELDFLRDRVTALQLEEQTQKLQMEASLDVISRESTSHNVNRSKCGTVSNSSCWMPRKAGASGILML